MMLKKYLGTFGPQSKTTTEMSRKYTFIPFFVVQLVSKVSLSFLLIFRHRRQHPPFSLHELQLLIDKRILNPEVPIDLATLCATHMYKIDPHDNQYGVNLTSEGIDLFKSKIAIEVQYADEEVIAAVERNGGTIRTAYYDIYSVYCLSNPERFFRKGKCRNFTTLNSIIIMI